MWSLCLVLTPGAWWLQHATAAHPDPVSSVRATAPVAFLWLMLAWLWPVAHQRVRVRLASVGLVLLVPVATLLLLGEGAAGAGRQALACTVQAAVTLAFYRWRTGDDNLVPHRPRDLGALLQACLLGAVVVLPIGPATGVGPHGSASDLLWWPVLSAGYVFVGGACTMLLVQRRPRTEAVPTRLPDVYGLLVVTGASIGVALAYDDQPLTWIVLLPAIWAGLTLGPWISAAFSLAGTASVLIAQSILALTGGYGGARLTEVMLLDVLMTAFVYVVLLLSLVRDQRAYLAGEVVRHRQEAMDQAGLLGTVFESIDEALVLMDPAGVVQLHNGAAVQILGRDKLLLEPARWLRRMAESRSFSYGYNRDGDEDGVRILAVQLAPVQYAGADGIVAIARDITVEQRRIEELASFAAVAAHDLKSPLTAVQGWVEVAEDYLHTDPQMALAALRRGRSATERMAQEIDDWLTYNVAREGVVRPVPVPLSPAVEAITASYPGVDFTVCAPDTVRADPTLLQHLLVNLIGNAVKYSQPDGRPSVAVRSVSGTDPGWVRLHVVDSGIGIPEGEESAVFEPFRRASTVLDSHEGSGLGLALCKRIVRRHGGLITARRNDGPGTTITVTLPRG